jgi:ribonuclease PH
MNVVMTGKGLFVEVQGTAEGQPFSEAELRKMTDGARSALERIREIQRSSMKGFA